MRIYLDTTIACSHVRTSVACAAPAAARMLPYIPCAPRIALCPHCTRFPCLAGRQMEYVAADSLSVRHMPNVIAIRDGASYMYARCSDPCIRVSHPGSASSGLSRGERAEGGLQLSQLCSFLSIQWNP